MTDLLRLFEGDWHTLHNIDMASYHQLIQGLTIEDDLNGPEGLIPRKAHHFADRLSKAVNSLFVETEVNSPNSWGQTRSVSENRQAHLVNIFTTAFKLKADTVTTDYRYKFEIHPVGISVPGLQADGRAEQTQFWKYATFHVYHGEASMPPDQFTDALVNPMNFIAQDEEASWMRHKYSKAVLLQIPNTLMMQEEQSRARWVDNATAYRREDVGQILGNIPTPLLEKAASDVSCHAGTASTIAQEPITCRNCRAVFTRVGNRNVHERHGEFHQVGFGGKRGGEC